MARRPNGYSDKLAERVLAAVTDGATLSAAAASCGVPRQTVRTWLGTHPDFAASFEAAKAVRIEVLAEQIEARANEAQQIAGDAAKNGGNPNAAVAALRVELESKRWLLSKLAPRQYGDKLTQEISGPGGRDLIPPPADPPTAEARTKLALALLNVLRADDPLPARALPAPEPPV